MDIEIVEWDDADQGGRVPDSLPPVDGDDVAGGVSVAGEVGVRRSRWIHAAVAELVAALALVVAPFLRVYSIRFGTGTMAIDGWGRISVSSSSLEVFYSAPLDGAVLLLEGASGHMRGRVVTSVMTTDGPE